MKDLIPFLSFICVTRDNLSVMLQNFDATFKISRIPCFLLDMMSRTKLVFVAYFIFILAGVFFYELKSLLAMILRNKRSYLSMIV